MKISLLKEYKEPDANELERRKQSAIDYRDYCEDLMKQGFKVGDKVIFEDEECEIVDIIDFDCCILRHKNHYESHLLKYCKKIQQ